MFEVEIAGATSRFDGEPGAKQVDARRSTNDRDSEFPQHAIKPTTSPATIAEIHDASEGMMPGQMLAVVAAKFPSMTIADLKRALKEHIKQLRAEATRLQSEVCVMEDIEVVCKSVIDAGEAEEIGDARAILAKRGDRRAAAYLAQVNAPKQQEFWRLMDLAIEADPYWEKVGDGRRYRVKRGAR